MLSFSALGRNFRLLVAFREDLEQYEAMLGVVDGPDTKILACYEFHGTHGGWHVHADCDSVDQISPGIKRSGNAMRLPEARARHRRTDFGINSGNALEAAADLFGIKKMPPQQWKLI